MGVLQKTESDSDYVAKKETTIKDYNYLLINNPFAPAEKLRDAWLRMYQRLYEVYKLSKKYTDTGNDIAVMKSYADDAMRRSNEYAFEIEYSKYQKEYIDLCRDYGNLIDEESIWDDWFDLSQKFEKLYNRSLWLINNYNRFKDCDIDVDLLNDIHSNNAFYYCELLLMLEDYKTDNGGSFNEVFLNDCYVKCAKVARNFADNRFKVMLGLAQYNQIFYLQKQDELRRRNGSYSDGFFGEVEAMGDLMDSISGTRSLESCTKGAKTNLSVLNNYNYCLSLTNNYLGVYLYRWEYVNMVDGVYDLVNLLTHQKEYEKAYRVLSTVIAANKNSFFRETDELKTRVNNGLIDLQSHFRRTNSGQWLYLD